MDISDRSPDIEGEQTADPSRRWEEALGVIGQLVPVLERERDLLVSGDWEGLDALTESKESLGRSLGELLSGLSTEERAQVGEEGSALRGALLHLSELTAVNLAIARESSQIVGQLLREISLDSAGGGTYGSSGSVDPARRTSPALVSTRG
ncbi:MAG: hypothetical protein ACP5OP_03945 [Leptospirillia bacterium]